MIGLKKSGEIEWKAFGPAESKYAWDYLKLVKTIPAEQAFMPLAQSTCYLVKR